MKKIFALLVLVCFSASMLIAQTARPASKEQAKKPATETKAPAKAATDTKATPLKKDGTPDMRFKENKEAAKPVAGPTKKDGTPDKRFKANKEAPAKK